MDVFIVSDVGGTQIRVAAYAVDSLELVNQKKIPTKSKNQLPIERLISLIKEVNADSSIKAIALAVAGYLDSDAGIVIEAPNIRGWNNYPLKDLLNNEFSVPIFMGNDANLAALAEWKFGAGIGHSNLLYLTVSTGIGGGAIVNNQLLLGAKGLGGEFGHTTVLPDGPLCGCGKHGHIEAISSGTGILKYVQEQISQGKSSSLSALEKISGKDISQAARQGDSLAIEVYQRAGFFLGIALANFVHILNPSIIIFGGGVASSAGDLIFESMRNSLQNSIISPAYLDNLSITNSRLGDEVGLKGALALLVTQFSPNLIEQI